MKLYHGSNVSVSNPNILVTNKTSDFGPGFYTTSSYKQAKNWSFLKASRQDKGSPTMSIFEIDESIIKKHLSVKEFTSPTEEWLDFVVDNRTNKYKGIKYDLVIGPVADDKTITVVQAYMRKTLTKEIAIQLLEPQNLDDQYAFLTTKALKYLTYKGSESL